MKSSRAARIIGATGVVALLTGCSVDERQEVAMGREYAQKIDAQVPLVTDSLLAGYVQTLGMAIAKRTSRANLEWHFIIVDSREVNAFALPGGYIYVNRGLIDHADRLDELAGAMGHEIGHVVRRHSMREMAKGGRISTTLAVACTALKLCDDAGTQAAMRVGEAAMVARYSRGDEAEADSEAVTNVVRAGIDPEGIPALLEQFVSERRGVPGSLGTFFATHPMEEDRIRATRAEIARLDPRVKAGLMRDDVSYQRFRERLNLLPPPRI